MGITYEEAEEVLLKCKDERLKAMYEEGIINPIVLAKAVNIRPQMVYNYIRQGKIKTMDGGDEGVSTNSTGHIVIDWTTAVLWVQKYVGRKADQQAKIDAQLRGEV